MGMKGPMGVAAIGMFKNFLILVELYGFTKVYPLVNRSKAFKVYKSFCEHAWDFLNRRLLYLTCDNS